MGEIPPTRPSLLLRIRDGGDAQAWSRFVEIYGPLVYDYGRRHGLQDADAADLTQEVLRTVAVTVGRFAYDPLRGSFRSWLLTVARTRRLDLADRSFRQPRGSGDSATADRLDAIPGRDGDRDSEQQQWDFAYRQRLLAWAAERIRDEFQESTWQAFWQTTVGGQAADVAGALGMSPGAVYMARSRVRARLRSEIEQVQLDVDEC